MNAPKIATVAIAAATLTIGTAAAARAVGTPQRSDKVPSGLAQAFERQVPGLLNAIMRTEGSNSRLQDLPASP